MTQPQPAHDPDDPMSHMNAIEAAWLATTKKCPHCHMKTRMIPMTGAGWAFQEEHERACPLHEDNQPWLEGYAAELPDEPA